MFHVTGWAFAPVASMSCPNTGANWPSAFWQSGPPLGRDMSMNIDLAKLGQIAGIAGIAIGVVALVLLALIKNGIGGLPARDRAPIVRIIAFGAVGIGVVGIAAWVVAGSRGGTSVATSGAGSGVAVGGRDANVGAPPAAPRETTPGANGSPTTPPPAGVRVETRGDRAPAAVGGRDAGVTIPAEPAGTQQPQR